jgi:hypothetical protein
MKKNAVKKKNKKTCLFSLKKKEGNLTFSISYFMGCNLPLFRTHNIYPTYLLLMENIITIVIK